MRLPFLPSSLAIVDGDLVVLDPRWDPESRAAMEAIAGEADHALSLVRAATAAVRDGWGLEEVAERIESAAHLIDADPDERENPAPHPLTARLAGLPWD